MMKIFESLDGSDYMLTSLQLFLNHHLNF